MLNPLALPTEVIAALRSVVAIERLLDERLSRLDDRVKGLDIRIERLPDRLEQVLREHFDRQREGIAHVSEELVANRQEAEKLPGKIDVLRDEIRALREEMRQLLGEVSEVRETVEPLQGPAERVARLSERLPGDG
jgi:prefoldin subunit 5